MKLQIYYRKNVKKNPLTFWSISDPLKDHSLFLALLLYKDSYLLAKWQSMNLDSKRDWKLWNLWTHLIWKMHLGGYWMEKWNQSGNWQNLKNSKWKTPSSQNPKIFESSNPVTRNCILTVIRTLPIYVHHSHWFHAVNRWYHPTSITQSQWI